MGQFSGKVICITGANGGIGKATVMKFASLGAEIIACCRHETDEFSRLINDIENEYRTVIHPIYFDLSEDESIKEGIKAIKALKLKINVLINNAGIPHLAILPFTKTSDLKNVFQINYFAQVLITQGLLSCIVKDGTGSIINAASIAGIDGDPGNSVYGATKASMILFTKVLSKELSSMKIRVNAVAPGLTDTKFAKLMGDKAITSMTETSSMHRLASAQEVADVYCYLASAEASFVNGQIIRIDGGIN